ncbi:MAG: 50S ribosomal protein L25 [Acidimicrobiales bacterium]|nr:50S ribosomal protein L25 [Acidimicrobiales bacterium]MCB1018097.1 50S ribosomal protein L25 [Acidimicrobiales bacterium]MCB9373252.1 50S ribosomal protein L25 [Microthrixaceae bacterium]
MAELTLTAETGRPTGSRASNRLRAEGKIPGVVYGLGTDPTSVAVDWRSLRQALTTDAGLNALINLQIDGEEHLTIVKELQRNPVKRTVTHVDFILIDREAEIEVEVPIVLEGEATEVERENGAVTQALFALAIVAKPGAIPDQLTADISELGIGDVVRVGDIALPDGVRTEVDPDDPVAVGEITRAAIEEEEEGEAAEGEGEEGAEAEASTDEGAGDSGGGDEG